MSTTTTSRSHLILTLTLTLTLTGELPEPEVFAHYEKLLHEAEAQILRAADVVCCTCIESATPRLQQAITVSLCVVDEAHQASEPEVLLPLSRAKQALLLEATEQEGSTVPTLHPSDHPAKQESAGTQQHSLFERHPHRVIELHGKHG